MSAMSFDGLLIISVIAVAAPVLATSVRRVKLPSVVVEIAAGIVVGPSVLAWVRIDQPVTVYRSSAWRSCSSWPGWRSTCGRRPPVRLGSRARQAGHPGRRRRHGLIPRAKHPGLRQLPAARSQPGSTHIIPFCTARLTAAESAAAEHIGGSVSVLPDLPRHSA